jgi:hypothetical protein
MSSSTLFDTFLEGIPEVTERYALDLYDKVEWQNFLEKRTGAEKHGSITHKSTDSNEEEFKTH